MKLTINIITFILLTVLMLTNSVTKFEYLILVFLYLMLQKTEIKIKIDRE